ncbi:glyoxalase domain-containing protein 4-like [Ruditapes philippinarum]|uniref:glyoxalase domain-containing protein 4-like n=1 Tax=Ruditapes philippinarum TaxID=129788 RepID=UPI00295A6406|nr:glyoxalase domain-containing protein 4-like [Ruditapes philippinarum]
MMSTRRALHFVFKVGNRTETAKFFREILGMKFLRHEEFEEGCKASCNGPYDGKWSKSMVGYGSEDNHFVIELTYNYGLGSYKLGNDFMGITVYSKSVLDNIKKYNYPSTETDGIVTVKSPDGYMFHIENKQNDGDPVKKVTLASSNLQKSVDFWSELCGMKVYSKADKTAVLGYADDQCKLELCDIGKDIDHATAFGRVAFSCPREELPGIQDKLNSAGQKILTPLVSLDTPGKATVEVVIPADPDGHEICFVGDEAFRELSQTDSKADSLLDEAMAADKSDEWFAKKGKSKASA